MLFALGVAGLSIGAIYLVAKRRKQQPKFELFTRPQPPPTFWGDVVRRSAKALITFAAIKAGKTALNRAMEQFENQRRQPTLTH